MRRSPAPASSDDAATERHPRGPRGSRAEAATESQKLQKILAQAGLGSRRMMETWIEAGRITVNGKVAGVGTRVMPVDRLQVDGRDIKIASTEAPVRVLLRGREVMRDGALLGEPLGAVLAWRAAKSPAGCLCSEPSRHHKWQAVLETLHFALRSAGDTAITLP